MMRGKARAKAKEQNISCARLINGNLHKIFPALLTEFFILFEQMPCRRVVIVADKGIPRELRVYAAHKSHTVTRHTAHTRLMNPFAPDPLPCFVYNLLPRHCPFSSHVWNSKLRSFTDCPAGTMLPPVLSGYPTA